MVLIVVISHHTKSEEAAFADSNIQLGKTIMKIVYRNFRSMFFVPTARSLGRRGFGVPEQELLKDGVGGTPSLPHPPPPPAPFSFVLAVCASAAAALAAALALTVALITLGARAGGRRLASGFVNRLRPLGVRGNGLL